MHRKQLQRIVFRVDADEHMGAGHVLRSLALAFGLQHFQCDILFLVNSGAHQVIESRDDFAFPVRILPENLTDEECLYWSKCQVKSFQTDLIVLDGYFFTDYYWQGLAQLAVCLVAIDDHVAPGVKYAGLILNTAPFAEKLDYSKVTSDGVKVLSGSKYCLLRPEFTKLKDFPFNTRNHLLLTFGGSDPLDLSSSVLPYLARMLKVHGETELIPIDLVTGPAYRGEGLDKSIESSGLNIYHHEGISNMVPLYQRACLAIASAGSTIYELAATGTPALLTIVADNQQMLALEAELSGWAKSFDFRNNGKREQLSLVAKTTRKYLNDFSMLERMHLATKSMRCAGGAINAAREIKEWFGTQSYL